MKRAVVVFALCLLMATTVWAAKAPAVGAPVNDVARYAELQGTIDFLFGVAIDGGVIIEDVRVSPVIRADKWFEYPIEIGVKGREAALPRFLDRLKMFGLRGGRLEVGNFVLSSLGSEDPKIDDVLSANVTLRALFFDARTPIDFCDSAAALAAAMRRLAKHATFGDGPIAPGQAGREPRIKLSNLSVDADGRVQMTGFGLHPVDVTRFGRDLLGSGGFKEVFLLNMNRTQFNGVGCWRFDLVARLPLGR